MTLYDPAIPQAQDILSESQVDLLNNFTDLDTYLRVNHIAFDNANFGKHKFLSMPKNTPGIATTPTEVGLYCRDDRFGDPQLYFRPDSASINTIGTQLTPMPSIFAWGSFDNGNPPVIGAAKYNIKNITKGGIGDFTIEFTNNLASQEYFPWFMPTRLATAAYANIISTTVNTIRVGFFGFVTPTGLVQTDPKFVQFIIWGD